MMSELDGAVERLAELGHRFDDEGVLRRIDDGERFRFDVHGSDHVRNEEAYDAMADAVAEYLAAVLVTKYGCVRRSVPVDALNTPTPHCVIYESAGARTNADKLLLVIQGSGAVRPGMWSRSAIINESLASGSILPYLDRATALGYDFVVLNPNANTAQDAQGRRRSIEGSGDAREHVLYVWDHFVTMMPAKRVDVVAHSYGGVSTCYLHDHRADEVEARVHQVAFTDAVHHVGHFSERTQDYIAKHAINWVRSAEPLSTFVRFPRGTSSGCLCLSAGHTKHEYTSGYCVSDVFAWLTGEKTFDEAGRGEGGAAKRRRTDEPGVADAPEERE